jgi:predicted protein tyrosine phosphatase
MRVRQRRAAEIGLTIQPPTIEHARQIIEFARDVHATAETVLFQCGAGISRSSAAALICLALWTQEGAEDDCVRELLRVRPAARPLRSLIVFGDHLLGRDGRLISATRRAMQV